MAEPQRTDPSQPNRLPPGKVRRTREADFSYLPPAANDTSYQSTDERFTQTAYQDNLIQPIGIGSQDTANKELPTDEVVVETVGEYSSYTPEQVPLTEGIPSRRNRLRRLHLPQSSTLTTKATAKVRASSINTAGFAWMVPLWLFWQVPIATLSIITLGITGYVGSLSTYVPNDDDGWVANAISWTTAKISSAALKVIETVIGINLAEIALPVYFILALLVLGIGVFSLLFIFFQYTLGFLKPLSGQAAGLKIGLFLLAIMGYATPWANLLPWVFLWMAAVWYYPR